MSNAQLEQACALLDAVRIRSASLGEAQRRYADQLAPNFHLVDHLRNDEMAISRYFSLLLDTRGSHAQGNLFLSHFVERLGACAEWINPGDLVSIDLEKQANGQRRLDIYLVFRNGVVGIENKPWADDQPDQLRDYADFLQASAAGGNWLLVYLCNEEPGDHSLNRAAVEALTGQGLYCRFDFHQVAEWLEHGAFLARAPKVRVFADALAGYVRREINGEVEMTEVEEIKNLILDKNEYMESAFQVSASVGRLKEYLLAELKDELGREFRALGMELVWDEIPLQRGSCYAGFGARFHPAHMAHLRFEFGATGLNSLEWGIRKNGADITLDPALSVLIRNAMKDAFSDGDDSHWWPWYPGQGQRDKVLAQDERNWSSNPVPWLRIRDKSDSGFVRRFVALAVEVREALKNVHSVMC